MALRAVVRGGGGGGEGGGALGDAIGGDVAAALVALAPGPAARAAALRVMAAVAADGSADGLLTPNQLAAVMEGAASGGAAAAAAQAALTAAVGLPGGASLVSSLLAEALAGPNAAAGGGGRRGASRHAGRGAAAASAVPQSLDAATALAAVSLLMRSPAARQALTVAAPPLGLAPLASLLPPLAQHAAASVARLLGGGEDADGGDEAEAGRRATASAAMSTYGRAALHCAIAARGGAAEGGAPPAAASVPHVDPVAGAMRAVAQWAREAMLTAAASGRCARGRAACVASAALSLLADCRTIGLAHAAVDEDAVAELTRLAASAFPLDASGACESMEKCAVMAALLLERAAPVVAAV